METFNEGWINKWVTSLGIWGSTLLGPFCETILKIHQHFFPGGEVARDCMSLLEAHPWVTGPFLLVFSVFIWLSKVSYPERNQAMTKRWAEGWLTASAGTQQPNVLVKCQVCSGRKGSLNSVWVAQLPESMCLHRLSRSHTTSLDMREAYAQRGHIRNDSSFSEQKNKQK